MLNQKHHASKDVTATNVTSANRVHRPYTWSGEIKEDWKEFLIYTAK